MFINYNNFRNETYSRASAVKYALTYALHPNPEYRYFPLIGNSSGDCANFISQCLKAGGAPMDFNPSASWWYNNQGTKDTKDDSWSLSWTVAHSLYWFLKIKQEKKLPGLKGLEISDVHMLIPGDVILYEDQNGLIFHSAIITAISSANEPLVSHHSYEALNVPFRRSDAYKMHFMKISI